MVHQVFSNNLYVFGFSEQSDLTDLYQPFLAEKIDLRDSQEDIRNLYLNGTSKVGSMNG